jgi:hypothetical protein
MHVPILIVCIRMYNTVLVWKGPRTEKEIIHENVVKSPPPPPSPSPLPFPHLPIPPIVFIDIPPQMKNDNLLL